MRDLRPGQLARLTSEGFRQGAARFFVNGSFMQDTVNLYEDPFIIISYPPKCSMPKYSMSPESWCEVMDSQGRVGTLYPVDLIEVIE